MQEHCFYPEMQASQTTDFHFKIKDDKSQNFKKSNGRTKALRTQYLDLGI